MIHTESSLRYKFEVIRKGSVIKSLPFREHMITDAGLDKPGAMRWCDCITTPIIGEGVSPTAVRRDSGSITFTQSGNTLTASSGFFQAGDVGRLFKWGAGASGDEVYITAFTSSTVVTVGGSATTVSTPTIGTIWYVNTAVLQTPIAGLTWSKNNNAAENFSTAATAGDTCTVTNQLTFFSSAFASPKTVSEIAFSENTTNSNVFDRDLITPTVALLAGDQAKVTVQLIVKWSPITDLAVPNVATGYDSSGVVRLESLCMGGTNEAIAYFSSSGLINGGGGCLDGNGNVNNAVLTAPITLQPFSATTLATAGAGVDGASGTLAAYGTGNRYRDVTMTFTIAQANGTIYGFCLAGPGRGGRVVTWKFNTPFTKTSSQTLSFTVRRSWSRILTN